MIDELEQLLTEAMPQTFDTMLAMPIVSQPPVAFAADERLVAASVGFIGEVTGVVYIYVTEKLALQITSRMLDMPEPEIEGHEMVNDTMGEMANMIVGQIKSRLCDRGRKCVLTIPSILRGQNFCVEPVTSTQNRKVGFRAQEHSIMVEILVKPSE